MKYRRDRPPRKPSKDDLLQSEVMQHVTKAAVAALREILADNPHQLLASVQPYQLDAVLLAAIGAYIDTRLAQENAMDDPIADLDPFL
jgi:hypothetical protein